MLHPIKKLVRIKPKGRTYKLFEMYEWEVVFDEDYFHLSLLEECNYHNAYDADENGILFRADAIFKNEKKERTYEIPVFAQKDKHGKWRWLIRFQPHLIGKWELQLFILHWTRSGDEKHKQTMSYDADSEKKSSEITYYEYVFGPEKQLEFNVYDTPPYLQGVLEKPSNNGIDNPNYFYRSQRDIKEKRERKLFFLLGFARPWVSEKKKDIKDSWSAYSYLDRKTELFQPMQKAGCNSLLHWMAAWESQLVHQSPFEHWYQPSQGRFIEQQSSSIQTKYLPGSKTKLDTSYSELGYKRYDQGRSMHTDKIFDLAKENKILLFLVVMSHGLLRDCNHPWGGFHFGKGDETSYSQCEEKFKKGISNRCGRIVNPEINKHSSQLNGFQLFRKNKQDPKTTIDIQDFFSMAPKLNDKDGNVWKRQLWKHFANFWRYIIARWAAHPALGAWILIDEMDGIGASGDWWWKYHQLTYQWHHNLVRLLQGALTWDAPGWKGKPLSYTGDYLEHPITSSATDYQVDTENKPRSIDDALKMYSEFKEKKNHGDWRGGEGYQKIDFVSHHAYQYIPTWGAWKNSNYLVSSSFIGWQKSDSGISTDEKTCQKKGAININSDRWLWDSLCMRLHNWSKTNSEKYYCPKLITEFGCWERGNSSEKYNQYGNRYPSYTHFAYWAGLASGHAGVPFKWNDAKEFGEMAPRTAGKQLSPLWNPQKYPVDNYNEIAKVANFLHPDQSRKILFPEVYRINLEDLCRQEELEIIGFNDDIDRNFNAWALIDKLRTSLIAWIYDRTFTTNGKAVKRWLKIKLAPNKNYTYVWYDTWNGKFIERAAIFSSNSFVIRSDDNGIVKIPLEEVPFPKQQYSKENQFTWVADGNDIAIKLTLIATKQSTYPE